MVIEGGRSVDGQAYWWRAADSIGRPHAAMAGLSGSPGGRRRGSEWPSGQLTVRVAGVAGRAAAVTAAGHGRAVRGTWCGLCCELCY
jgi:hypothetical protein